MLWKVEFQKNVGKQFDILPSTLSNKELVAGTVLRAGRERTRPGEFPHLEVCLVKWIVQCRGQTFP